MRLRAVPPELPRELLPEERATLFALLNFADFEGRDALLEQANAVRPPLDELRLFNRHLGPRPT